MKLPSAVIFFFIVAGIEIIIQAAGLLQFDGFIKPLIVPWLVLWYLRQSTSKDTVFVLALLFCWAGDVLLLLAGKQELFFIGGLGSFLVAHVLLIRTYQKLRHEGEGLNGPQRARAAFPVLLAATGLVVVLYPRLGDLKLPVIVYALILAVMVCQSFFRYGFTSPASFWSVSGGAFLFMLSDSLLALNQFYAPLPLAGVWVMSTYMAAVFFIVRGVIRHPQPTT